MRFSRRQFLGAAPAALCAQTARPAIGRRAVVERHNPVLHAFDGRSPLSVGNGEFAFTADVTGLQTFPALYDRQMPLFNWLRENPHRLHLGKIGFLIEKPGDLAAGGQTLDLWTGTLRSEFQWNGQRVVVETACHPTLDLLAVRVRGRIPVSFEFPYGSGAMNAADWSHPEKHRSQETASGANRLDIVRQLDRDAYSVGIAWQTARDRKWDDVRTKLSPLPVKDGVYLAHENCPQTFTGRNRDHPSMLGALGVLPGTKVDQETMRRTLQKVFAEWKWADTWGWDFPMVAMTAASLGERQLAIDALMMDTPKNTWLPNGHNWQRANLPLYLPGNGGLLLAVAHMARLAAFPESWNARWEGLG